MRKDAFTPAVFDRDWGFSGKYVLAENMGIPFIPVFGRDCCFSGKYVFGWKYLTLVETCFW